MKYPKLAKQIIDLKKADLAMRDRLIESSELNDGYNEQMEALHNVNADKLQDIIDEIGFPSIDKVGKEASDAAWLVIQHAISKPLFMKSCLTHLQRLANNEDAYRIPIAYLSDRIAVFQDKPQLYGTQFDWDDQGMMSPQLMDDAGLVNQRRHELGLNTVEQQTIIMRRQAVKESEVPQDSGARKKEYDEWRKKVGWIR
ncbi:DUF6624 domain-containing protein [Nonlabens ponticola]|uniref:Uncharacterized protein n=1 Tax=Nonlabens ponticola TaxID=2496866 RepID=A0A3S9MVX1_9FLAO|nr:DUF6624 domain-containing protein [Nonlabens ponticola]AZQ43279.1 hypothetical protein EJ995_03150 [Nonlabens ponticola]